MVSNVKQLVLQVTSQVLTVDGVSSTVTVDLSTASIGLNFAGNEPALVVNPLFGTDTAELPATATITGNVVAFTFPSPPPQFDADNNQIQYTATFSLQFNS